MPIRALLFDLDDTLAVDEAVSHETFAHVAAVASSRFGVAPAEFARNAMQIARDLWSEGACRPYCRSIGISAFECLWGGFTGETPELTALRLWAQEYRLEVFAKTLAAQLESYPADAPEFLASEFSSTRRARQRAPDLQREKIEATGLKEYFQSIAVSGEYGIGKPRREIFDRLLEELKVSSEEVVMVGNSLERDIAGARNAGIRSIWIRVPGSEEHAEVIPDFTIVALQEVPTVLQQLGDLVRK